MKIGNAANNVTRPAAMGVRRANGEPAAERGMDRAYGADAMFQMASPPLDARRAQSMRDIAAELPSIGQG